jgi:phosphate transport system permease protein
MQEEGKMLLIKKGFRPENALFACATLSASAVILITVFVFKEGVPPIIKTGLISFLTGDIWSPGNGEYGILSLLAGSFAVVGTALLIAIPTGVAVALFLSQILKNDFAKPFKFAIELLAGIPSVVYGFIGLTVLVPFIKEFILPIYQVFNKEANTTGSSILAGGVVLAIMILPTIISISENSISSVPKEYKEASLAVGANPRQTQLKILLPAAKSGIIASVILGLGRAVGETMAVLLITGNVAMLPENILSPVATLTGTIALEMGYANEEHKSYLFAIGVVLFIIIFILNIIALKVTKRRTK